MTTVIIDYDSGNLHSAHKAFQRMADEVASGQVALSSDPDVVRRADRIVLPGDGAFPACRTALFDHRGLFEALEEVRHDQAQVLVVASRVADIVLDRVRHVPVCIGCCFGEHLREGRAARGAHAIPRERSYRA